MDSASLGCDYPEAAGSPVDVFEGYSCHFACPQAQAGHAQGHGVVAQPRRSREVERGHQSPHVLVREDLGHVGQSPVGNGGNRGVDRRIAAALDLQERQEASQDGRGHPRGVKPTASGVALYIVAHDPGGDCSEVCRTIAVQGYKEVPCMSGVNRLCGWKGAAVAVKMLDEGRNKIFLGNMGVA
jgi:hypothetical protein